MSYKQGLMTVIILLNEEHNTTALCLYGQKLTPHTPCATIGWTQS
jgi:hypothetical protein